MLITLLWMALAASGGVLSGIIYDKVTSNPDPVMPVTNSGSGIGDWISSLKFFKTLKTIGILTAGAFAVFLLIKIFKIKLFSKFTK